LFSDPEGISKLSAKTKPPANPNYQPAPTQVNDFYDDDDNNTCQITVPPT